MINDIPTTTARYKKMTDILGKKYVRSTAESPYDFIQMASKGINANVIINFRKYFNLGLEQMAQILNISEPTIYRWVKSNKKLERNFSVLLFELTDLFLYGMEVFGTRDNFFKWVYLPNTALGGMEPLELVEIPGGISKVKNVIGRIEHGVYS